MEPRSSRAAQRLAAVLLGAGVLSIVGFVAFTASGRRAEVHARRAAFAVATPGADGARIVRIDVEGMTCPGCAKTVEAELRKVAGVTACRVDLASQVAEVRLASADVPTGALVAAVGDAGFEAQLEPESPAAP